MQSGVVGSAEQRMDDVQAPKKCLAWLGRAKRCDALVSISVRCATRFEGTTLAMVFQYGN